MSVAAGAVAAAIAPSAMASGVGKRHRSSTTSTSSTAVSDSKHVTVIMRAPSFFMWLILNSPPMEKAMKPSATVTMLFKLSTISNGIILRKLPPIMRPATR